MRKRIFEIIEVAKEHDKMSHLYDLFMIMLIIVSIIPLAIKEPSYIGWVCSGKEFSLTQIVNFRCSIFANRKADLYGMDNSRSYRNSVSGVLAGV